MTIPSFCVPSPCSLTTPEIGCDEMWNLIKDTNITYNSLYSGFYSFLYQTQYLTNGLTAINKLDLQIFAIRIGTYLALPYLITFTFIIYILYSQSIISDFVSLLLLIILYLFAIFGIIFLYNDVGNTFENIIRTTSSTISNNWNTNRDDIIKNTRNALIMPSLVSCRKT